MSLIFADLALRRVADSNIAWYHCVVPELQTYWITPAIFAHQAYSASAEPLLVRTEFGQEAPRPLEIKRLFRGDSADLFSLDSSPDTLAEFDRVVEECVLDYSQIPDLGPRDCVYVREAGVTHVQAALVWLRQFGCAQRPRAIIHLAASHPSKLKDSISERIRKTLASELQTWVKLIVTDEAAAPYLENLFQFPVECWPNPHVARITPKYKTGASGGRLLAILGNQTTEKGIRIVPELARQLLDQYPNAAFLVHHALGAKTLDIEPDLLAVANANKRMVYMPRSLTLNRWNEILSAIDLAILPYDPAVFRHRGAWLLDELIANGVPAAVPANTSLETRMNSFGISGRTFAEQAPSSIARTVNETLARYDETAKAAWAARERWAKTQGANRLVANILSWFPEQRPIWQGWSKINGTDHRSKRILLSWAVDPSYMPPPTLSDNQITVGPHPLATAKTFLRPNTAQPFAAYTPFFHTYDLKAVMEAQGITGPFDLVVVSAESSFGNVPLNVSSFGCPTLLYAGDTHWGKTVLKRMVDYAVFGGFDYVVTTFNRQHLHWYDEAGKQKVAWIPALAAEHLPISTFATKQPRIAFSGQRSDHHVRRVRLLNCIEKSRLPLDIRSLSREDAAAFYNSSLLSFNTSLNGDLNLRTFEVMSAGGCLLTDRLTPESGQALLFEEGQDYLGYSSEGELLEITRRCLADPEQAIRIAANGHKTYTGNFLPERQIAALMDWIFSGNLKPEYGSSWDARPEIAASDPLPLTERMTIYERLQHAHLEQETVRVLVTPGVPACVIADMIDLPRLTCYVLEAEQTVRPVLERFGLGARVKYVESLKRAKQGGPWDYLIARSDAGSEIQASISHGELIRVSATNPPSSTAPQNHASIPPSVDTHTLTKRY